LTGLSHVYNLYFVAVKARIYVYQPSFPEQHLPASPDIILTPPKTTDVVHDIPIGIDHQNPHSINHLLVDFLGKEEVVVVCHDDGDVLMYRTEAVHDELMRRESREEPNEVHEFFGFHVNHSAWGLAIHQESRLLAVTCNAHTTTIFAFALVNDTSEPDAEESKRTETKPDILNMFTTRVSDIEIELDDTGENLPCVAFNNTGADPQGRWLLTGDISGTTYLWDIPTQSLVGRMNYMFCSTNHIGYNCSTSGYPHASKSFVSTYSELQTNGHLTSQCGLSYGLIRGHSTDRRRSKMFSELTFSKITNRQSISCGISQEHEIEHVKRLELREMLFRAHLREPRCRLMIQKNQKLSMDC
jgi:hypothetical protein